MLRTGLNYSSRSFQLATKRIATNKPTGIVAQRNLHIPTAWSRWFNVPKGFEKFFRRGGSTKTENGGIGSGRERVDPKFTSDKTRKSGGTGGNQDSKKPEDENNMAKIIGALGLLGVSTVLLADDLRNGREISWHDFQKQLLETGQVDRIIVSNKNIAKIVLRGNDVNGTTPEGVTNSTSTPHEGEFGWSKEGKFDASADANVKPADVTSKFQRYPSLGSPNNQVSTPFYFNIGTIDTFERKLEESQRALGIQPRDFIPVIYVNETSWASEIGRFLPTLLLIGAMFYMTRGAMGGAGGSGGPGGIFKVGKSTAKRINKENVTTTFADVAGCDEAKREIMEFVQFLKDPKKFTDLGAKIPKGALLCGPPGTGKTLLAKATAGEANVPFFSASGSDFIEMFVGVGASRVRDLFQQARKSAPCIIFIDEIDAIGKQRGKGGFSGGNDERESTLNQLLVEMDGFDNTTNIVVLAGTNRIDVLDNALKRPGRFDRQITVDRPDIKGRKQIFEVYLKNIRIDGEVADYSARLAALTPGFVGADIANICNEAAIVAARKDKTKVDLTDFESATDRVIGGLESKKIMSPEEKRVVAYHEAGHAVAGWNLEYADPLLKVTIVPRGSGALGYAQYLPKELFLRTRDQIMDMVCMALAGRAAEQVTFGKVTTGAADDLRRVTQIVYQMVQVYGMNEKIGQLAFPKEDGQWPQDRLYSNATAEVMDEEVRKIVDDAYKRTIALMEEKRGQVEKVAELLIQKETITNIDVAKAIGKRPYSAGAEYEEYLNTGWKGDQDEKKIEDISPDTLSPA